MLRKTRNIAILLLLISTVHPVDAQIDYGSLLGSQQAGRGVSYAPQGPGTMLGAVEPAVRRWFLPQHMYAENRWRQWEYTNYAREPFERPVSTDLAGDYFYDLYGNRVTQGWLIFNSGQSSPQDLGNVLFKSNRFKSWFAELVVAGDHKGQYHYALSVSSNLRTTFTPMSFSKPRLDGIQFDAATDKYDGTLVYSRMTGPRGTQGVELPQTNNTTLFGGRIAAQVGDFVKVGAHTVNVHQSNTRSSSLVENQFRGGLTTGQNQTISSIQIVLADDSPDDGIGGAAYFPSGSDVIITYRDGTVDRGSDLRFKPIVEGGVAERGYVAANGREQIRLTYDFNDPAFVNQSRGDLVEVVGVEFRLVLANDYQIWMTSDQQTSRAGEPVPLLVAQSEGNIKDLTNLRTVSFDYGLPTATTVLGWTLNLSDLWGMDLYGEYDLSWSYRKYPNVQQESHKAKSGIDGKRKAPAWMLNLSKKAHPFFFFGEAYALDPLYNTQSFVADASGNIDYSAGSAAGSDIRIFYDGSSSIEAAQSNLVDLVEDNDDQDRIPDNLRSDWQSPDRQVFPGWDENSDFLPDFNQNDNRVKMNSIPDYEEPFLRFNVDRPEFLFGMDMNNNFWVDQYENDAAPDYPYRKDHKGYNVYVGAHLAQGMRLMLGNMREEKISSDLESKSFYGLLTHDVASSRYGTLRFFQMAKHVEDNIPDPLLQWSPENTIRGGRLTPIKDPLIARDTFVNQTYIGHVLNVGSLKWVNKANYVLYRQLMDREKRASFNLDQSDFFLGIINKLSYRHEIGKVRLQPRWKSEFRHQTRGLFNIQEHTSLTQLLSAIVQLPLLKVTNLEAGVEYVLFNDMEDDFQDFNSLLGAIQFTNTSAYQGYVIKSLVGVSVERKAFVQTESSTGTQAFITVYAGLE